jgi:dienelactone hydrolase
MAWPLVFDIDPSMVDHRGDYSLPSPTVIIIHDAFHTPQHLEQLATNLRASSHRVFTPDLRTSEQSVAEHSMEHDILTVVTSAVAELESGRDVVLVLCGFSATLGTIAANRLNQYSLECPRAGEVTRLVIMSGVILDAGESHETAVRPHWIHEEVTYQPHDRSPDLLTTPRVT